MIAAVGKYCKFFTETFAANSSKIFVNSAKFVRKPILFLTYLFLFYSTLKQTSTLRKIWKITATRKPELVL